MCIKNRFIALFYRVIFFLIGIITLIYDFPEKKCLPLCRFVKYPYLCRRKEQKDAG